MVYFLQETLRIPWMQDFRLDGGEYVIQYVPEKGDAIVMDSQMSCHYKFGIISCNSDGAALHIQPSAAGPDRFQVFTTTSIHINALVGGGGSWKGARHSTTNSTPSMTGEDRPLAGRHSGIAER
ncbi:MAG: hypothetical protein R3B91_17985 [Planctomycetaceae bacterium]